MRRGLREVQLIYGFSLSVFFKKRRLKRVLDKSPDFPIARFLRFGYSILVIVYVFPKVSHVVRVNRYDEPGINGSLYGDPLMPLKCLTPALTIGHMVTGILSFLCG